MRDPRWAAVVARSKDADFFYAVETTGVYCRPDCSARLPLPQNVVFYRSGKDAERAGFRPCKRCKPSGPPRQAEHVALVSELCRFIEAAEEPPALASLAARAGMSEFHLHRLFKAITGVTPKAYATAHRRKRVRTALRGPASVTDAILAAGFNAGSRFYESDPLGMTPTSFRGGGVDTEIHFAVGACSLGSILVATAPRGVCAIALGDDPAQLVRELQDRFSKARLVGGDAKFETLVARVVGFIEAPAAGLDLPLDIRGTAFQQRVWTALQKIPAGETLSYAELAKRLGAPKSVRAVASACAANTLAVAIPCHRVVRTDGALSGYRWGVERKRALLDREYAVPGEPH